MQKECSVCRRTLLTEEDTHLIDPSDETIYCLMCGVNRYRPIGAAFKTHSSIRCKGKTGTDKENDKGYYIGLVSISERQQWAVVLWDGEEEPDLYKADCLMIIKEAWASLI